MSDNFASAAIIARAEANIRAFADLVGKPVNVGSQETGTQRTRRVLAAAIGQGLQGAWVAVKGGQLT